VAARSHQLSSKHSLLQVCSDPQPIDISCNRATHEAHGVSNLWLAICTLPSGLLLQTMHAHSLQLALLQTYINTLQACWRTIYSMNFNVEQPWIARLVRCPNQSHSTPTLLNSHSHSAIRRSSWASSSATFRRLQSWCKPGPLSQ
jgi:hypothetical protein